MRKVTIGGWNSNAEDTKGFLHRFGPLFGFCKPPKSGRVEKRVEVEGSQSGVNKRLLLSLGCIFSFAS